MNETRDEMQREISEHSAKALRLFEEAKQIQQQIHTMPVLQRQSAMNKVSALESEAIGEAQKSILLEMLLKQKLSVIDYQQA